MARSPLLPTKMLVLLWDLQTTPLRLHAALVYQGRVWSEQSWDGALSYDTYDRPEFQHAWPQNERMLMGFQLFRSKAECLARKKNQRLLLATRNASSAQHCLNELLSFHRPHEALFPYGALRENERYETRELVVLP